MRKIFIAMFLAVSVLITHAADGYKRNPSVDVLKYNFGISINDTSDVIFGTATISISIKGAVSSMEFDLNGINAKGKGMTVDSVALSEFPVKWEHAGDKLKITTASDLISGSMALLKIKYHGIPPDGLIISKTKFGTRSFFSDNWPDRARNYLPCIDHPYDKAKVEFSITAPEHYEIVASGYLVEESHTGYGFKFSRWREDVPLATKVMAFGAADFDFRVEEVIDKTPVWTYVFKENRKEGFNDYSIAVKPVKFFSELIGPYPYEKLANVQSKTTFGGLENAGCIFYSENSVTGNGKAERLIAHEIAHQWFGNSVTESDWHHVWLSEGFATYLTAVYIEENYGIEALNKQMAADRERVIKYALRNPGPVIDTLETNLMRLLNANSYQKGSWVLHMLRHEVGDEIFWKGIRDYYKIYRDSNALTGDFRRVMEVASNRNLGYFFEQWLVREGFPELKITWSDGNKGTSELLIEQCQEKLFSFPLELQIITKDTLVKREIRITEKVTSLNVELPLITGVIPDPDVHLLFRKADN